MCEQGIKVVGAGAPASQVQDRPPDRRESNAIEQRILQCFQYLTNPEKAEFLSSVVSWFGAAQEGIPLDQQSKLKQNP